MLEIDAIFWPAVTTTWVLRSRNVRFLQARCAMVAKHVELAATSASAVRQGKRQVQPSTQEQPERLGVDPRCSQCGERGRSQRAVLGPQQCPPRIVQAGPHNMGGESFLQLSGGLLLPTVPRLVGFGVLETFRRCEGQLCPRRHHQTCRCQRVFALTNCLEARRCPLLQMPDHQLSNEGVSNVEGPL